MDSAINIIFIKIGDNCNFSCKYCTQGYEYKRTKMPTEANPFLYKLINKVKKYNHPVIIFSGGESLLYFEKIKEFVGNVGNINVSYRILTNGYYLTEDIVKFLNSHKFEVTISWDGRHSASIRGYDVFKNIELKNLIFSIDRLNINALITAKSYPFELCEDIESLLNEYNQFNPTGKMTYFIDEITDFNLDDKSILDIDYERVSMEVNKVIVKSKTSQVCEDLLNYYKNLLKNNNIYSPVQLGSMQLHSIAMDLGGNLFPVSSATKVILGNVTNIGISDYLHLVREFDSKNRSYMKDCLSCEYKSLCTNHSRLMYLFSVGGSNVTCKLKKAIADPIIEHLKINNQQKD